MKLGIVTIWDLTNYGNRLQNYALSYILRKKLGHRAETLVSIKEKPFENGNYLLWIKHRIAGACCVAPTFAEKQWGAGMTRWRNFHRWSKQQIPVRYFYRTSHLPEALQQQYDLFLAGSDQIWNWQFPSTKFDDYFLRFARDEQKIAYSASFGVDHLPEALQEAYREGLEGFAHLSVREAAGARLAEGLLGREVPVLIDPTMLLTAEEWLCVAKKPRVDIAKPYVLKYYLGEEEESEKIDHWAKANGYAVYELMNPNLPELYSAGPGEFLTLLANAAFVASDSYHCIVFSILFHRPFAVYERRGKEGDMRSRLDTLLGTFGFEDRWKHRLSDEDYLRCDTSRTDAVLELERQRAMDYLRTALHAERN